MAYVSQEMKKSKAPAIKAVLAKYGVRGTISVDNHSTLVVTIKEGVLDLIGEANKSNSKTASFRNERFYPVDGHYDVNIYWIDEHYTGKIRSLFKELLAAMRGTDWFDDSNAQIDYFHTAFYTQISVGRWNKPYVHSV